MSDDRPGFLPYGRQSIDDDDIEAVVEALRSDYLTTGPRVEAFEESLAAVCGTAHAAALSSGTAALHAAYAAAGLGPGDEIVTSPLTFAATANAALWCGATVRFADVDPATGNLDPERAAEAVTRKTRLLVPVDYAGLPADYDRLTALASEGELTLVADASHSLGATHGGHPVGSLAEMTVLSFHPVKVVTTAEGGAVATDSDELYQRVVEFRTHGIGVRPGDAEEGDEEEIGPWYRGMHDLGLNYRLSDLHAALGRSQLAKLEHFVARRREIAGRYFDELAGVGGLELPPREGLETSAWHLFVVQVAPDRRRRFFEALREAGLGVQVHYLPVYWHPYYRDFGYEPGLCPAAEERYRRSVSLPLYPAMSDDDAASVIERVGSVAAKVL